ncbi:hypothetical protein WISP_129253 [Willisornis vidua]|uniref:Uncharacterized protein n=1 Tax=Willisornis vidua TaxID=1566151 RepID=A0ABQ9CW13_9PASS|nr:hypothetical protein WISP_129253 [Willisornis vidua]
MSATPYLLEFGVVHVVETGANTLNIADEGWTYILPPTLSFTSLSESQSSARVTAQSVGKETSETSQPDISNPKLKWKSDIISPDPIEVKGSFVIDFNKTRIHPRKEYVSIPLASLLYLKLIMHLMYLTRCSSVLLGLTVYQETSVCKKHLSHHPVLRKDNDQGPEKTQRKGENNTSEDTDHIINQRKELIRSWFK